tara:strand:+ start:1605 stop:1808 length:204 start_codon:yes stop_codon:yes gene_type:complete
MITRLYYTARDQINAMANAVSDEYLLCQTIDSPMVTQVLGNLFPQYPSALRLNATHLLGLHSCHGPL